MTPKQKHEKLEYLESELARVRERFGDIITADASLHDGFVEAWLAVSCAVARAADEALAAGEPVLMAEAVPHGGEESIFAERAKRNMEAGGAATNSNQNKKGSQGLQILANPADAVNTRAEVAKVAGVPPAPEPEPPVMLVWDTAGYQAVHVVTRRGVAV